MTPTTSTATRKEDEIFREWTPVILRTLLIVAALVLVIGLVMAMVSRTNREQAPRSSACARDKPRDNSMQTSSWRIDAFASARIIASAGEAQTLCA
jgi:hypothetical protein